jgi:peptidoglycan/LPS O-acetylase OafA/YrhL
MALFAAADSRGSLDIARDKPFRWLETGRVPGLDGLRAISILLVLVEHASGSRGFPVHERWLGDIGAIGVAMFFGISGFLITTLLVREWNGSGAISLTGFYWRRALRILPAYVVFLMAMFALTRIGAVVISGSDWAAALTYTMNFVETPAWEVGHVWSLSVEEQFYVCWPLIVVLLSPGRALWVVAGYLVAAPVVRTAILLFFPGQLDVIEFLTPLRMDSIAAGCLLALLASRQAFRERARIDPRRAGMVTAAAAGVIVLAYVASLSVAAFDLTLDYSIVAIANAVIIWSVAMAPATRLGRMLALKPVVFVGVLSYSLYLWQEVFLNRAAHWWTAWPQNLVLSVLAAVASYYIVELPFLRIKDRGARHAHAAAPAPVRDRELPRAASVTVG